jgi:L-lactate dehydrogenase (cytochrome)
MKPREIPSLMRVARPPAPYGVQALARCCSIDDLARLARARAAGFHALLLSVDGALHPLWAWHFLTSEAISFPNISRSGPESRAKVEELFDGTMTWADLDWIRDAWDGPIALKGVLRPDEARRAADDGLDGVIVSNHGGRQLDHLPATIDVLAGVVAAADGRLEVLLDSGVRRGSDIVAALALGARAVLIGRAHLYGLAAAGEAGVRHAVDILANELRMTMALAGVTRLDDVGGDLLRARGAASVPSAH